MDVGLTSRWGAVLVYNNTGQAIPRGLWVNLDFTNSAAIPNADVEELSPYDKTTQAFVAGLTLGDGTSDTEVGGVALHEIADNASGLIQMFGYCLANVAETTARTSGSQYTNGTAGQLGINATPSAGTRTVAIQIGDSGTTLANSLRRVFVNGLGDNSAGQWSGN